MLTPAFTDPLHWLMGTRLEVPTKLVPADVLFGLVALAVLLPVERLLRRRRGAPAPDALPAGRRPLRTIAVRVAWLLGGALAGFLLTWIIADALGTIDVDLTPVTRMWIAMAFGGLGLAVVGFVHGGRGRRVLAGLLVVLSLIVPALGVNVDFAAYPTLNALVQADPYPDLDLALDRPPTDGRVPSVADWHAPVDMPRHGVIGTVTIPGRTSGFPARPAVVWLPPAARVADAPALPVVFSLSGQPGSPSDMFAAGGLDRTMDRYARLHHGLAPIVVSVDQLAVPGHNTMCVDSKIGKAASYITRDVPAWVESHFRVVRDRSSWGLLGFSQGATCAAQFLTGHPGLFSAAVAVSSELFPLDRSPQNSADSAFGGSLSAWRKAAPIAMMRAHGPYEHSAVWFTAGATDQEFVDHARRLSRAARQADITTSLRLVPDGGHDWNTVQWSLRHDLPQMCDWLFAPLHPRS